MNGSPTQPAEDRANDPSAPADAAARDVPPKAPANDAAGELDLDVEEIKPLERMKEGFVGQER